MLKVTVMLKVTLSKVKRSQLRTSIFKLVGPYEIFSHGQKSHCTVFKNHPKNHILQNCERRKLKIGIRIIQALELENILKNETFCVIFKHCASEVYLLL